MDRIRASRTWMWTTLGLILLAGASAGVIGDRLLIADRLDARSRGHSTMPLWFSCVEGDEDFESHPSYPYQERHRSHLNRRLTSELDLLPEQVDELGELLERRRQQARIFWGASRHDYCEMRASFRADIRALLDPDQEAIYDQLIERVDARERERWHSAELSPHEGKTPKDGSR